MGDALRQAMQSELQQVNFRPVWTAVNEAIEKEERSRSESFISNLMELFTPRRIAAAAATAVVLVVTAIIVWQFTIAPAHLEAAPTTVESIQYGDDVDIVIGVETLGDSLTTVVWINGLDVNEGIVEE